MSYHAKMMNVQLPTDETTHHGYKQGHRDARHACAEIASEADACIASLESRLAASEGACAGLRAALEKIAKGSTAPKDASPAFFAAACPAAGTSYVQTARQALDAALAKLEGGK